MNIREWKELFAGLDRLELQLVRSLLLGEIAVKDGRAAEIEVFYSSR